MTGQADSAVVHASCVVVGDRGLLIRGPAGSGKSALALQLMALGARLVADDQTVLQRDGGDVVATCPPALSGMIEARFVGILWAEPVEKARIRLVADLGQTEADRLPQARTCDLMGTPVPLVFRAKGDHFPASLLCYLSFGRHS